jgi:catechol 2,3-dioxygenase-like lactoylglutathione lyase family enzyme
VPDVDAALKTYTTDLGFPVSWPKGEGDGWTSAAAWLGDCSLELLQPISRSDFGAGVFARALERRGAGLFAIAFDPPNLAQSVGNLTARGVQTTAPVTYAAPVSANGDFRGFTTVFIPRKFTAGLNTFICQYDSPFKPTEGGKGPLKVKKLDHVIIATEDVEDAAGLWEKNLGLKVDESMNHPLGAGFKVARLPIGESFLELVQPVEKEGRFYEQFQERGEGMFSISVEVEDLDESVSFLRDNGVKVSEPEASIWPGARLARINHEYTHGVSIQLIERK